jgi:hypothetical protein
MMDVEKREMDEFNLCSSTLTTGNPAMRKLSEHSETEDWKVLDPRELVKGDTSLTSFINGCKNKL